MMLPEHDCDDDSIEPELLRGLTEDQKKRLTEQLDRYLRGLEAGDQINLESFSQQHPDLKEVFAVYLEKLNALYGVAVGFQNRPANHHEAGDRRPDTAMTLGDFTILREIGRGGMGVVYEARQRSLDRRVAIKLLPITSLLDQSQIARFKNEAHAAGLLQHPNIVPIHSVGSDRGVHYYAMQLIDGTPIDHWVRERRERDAEHRDAESDSTWQAVINSIADIADALHSAHETGVIHRDVKPSNLLQDRSGKMWITDFGLARCQDNRSITASGDVLGTIRYMSPEQASGKSETIDHRTDVYSLGTTLFEMLTLRPAVEGDDGPAMLHSIVQNEPQRLRAYRPDLPRDLSVVLGKAMAKRKDDRYESAKQFAADLRCVAAGLPILAKPQSATVWVSRWIMRHRRAVSAGLIVLTLAMVWMTISSVTLRQQVQRTKFAESKADQHFRQSHRTVNQLGSQVAQQLASIPGTEHVRQSLLNQTLDYYQQFAAAAEGDPKLIEDLAVTHSRIGSLVKELDSSQASIAHYRRSAELFTKIAKSHDQVAVALSDQTKLHEAENLNSLALALSDIGKTGEAMAMYERAIQIQRSLVESSPNDVGFATQLAVTTNNLGLLLQSGGQRDKARRLLDNAVARLSAASQQHPGNELASRALSAALVNLSSLSMDSDPDRATDLLREALGQRLASIGQSSNRLRASAEVAAIYNNLGSAFLRQHRFADSESAFSDAVRLLRQLHGIAPSVVQYDRDLAMSLNNLAIAQQRQSKHAQAAASAREAVARQSESLTADGHDPSARNRLGAMHHNLATSLMALEKYADAELTLQQAVEQQQAALAQSPNLAEARSFLLSHYSNMLRCQIRSARWHVIEATASDYREAAGADPILMEQVRKDLAEAAELKMQLPNHAGVNNLTTNRTVSR